MNQLFPNIRDTRFHNWSDLNFGLSLFAFGYSWNIYIMVFIWDFEMKRIDCGDKGGAGYQVHVGPMLLYYQSTDYLPAWKRPKFKIEFTIVK